MQFVIREDGELNGWPTYKWAVKRLPEDMAKVETVKDALESSAKVRGDKTYAIYADTGDKMSYSELNKDANKVANALAELGVKKGDRVALFLRNSLDYLRCIYACSKIGAIEVPVNWFYREFDAKHVIRNSEASVCIVEDDLLPILEAIRSDLPDLKHIIVRGETKEYYKLEDLKGTPKNPETKITAEDPMAIIYTSGTTGLPKGTILSNRSYVLSAKAITLWMVDENANDYTGLPLFHINAQIYSSLGIMFAGGTLTLRSLFSASMFWEDIMRYKCTHFNLLGSLANILYSLPPSEYEKETPAKYVIIGGMPIEIWRKFEERFGVEVLEGYSMTEDPLPCLNPPGKYKKIGSFGVPVFPDLGHDAKIVDENGNELPFGSVGELIRRNPAQMIGYYKAPEKTAEVIKDGWLYSGDFAKMDEQGYLYFVDRKKFVVRRSGENIASWEIEAVLKGHPKIADVAVIPVPDPMRGEEIKAFIIPKYGEELKEEEIIEFMAKKVAYFKVPRFIEIVDNLPYTPTGRVKKWELKEREKNRTDHGWDRDKMIPDWRTRFKTR
ncbi:MAG: AMP-binding protein [Archaeoglobaceae archaeon]|nr:AMP-binding protein [Archaeoglobaceae archaeon]